MIFLHDTVMLASMRGPCIFNLVSESGQSMRQRRRVGLPGQSPAPTSRSMLVLRPLPCENKEKGKKGLRHSMRRGRTWVDKPGEGGQQEGQVALKCRAKGFQASEGRPHELVAAAALRLAKQRHKLGQQAGQVRPHVISQGHCAADVTSKSHSKYEPLYHDTHQILDIYNRTRYA